MAGNKMHALRHMRPDIADDRHFHRTDIGDDRAFGQMRTDLGRDLRKGANGRGEHDQIRVFDARFQILMQRVGETLISRSRARLLAPRIACDLFREP